MPKTDNKTPSPEECVAARKVLIDGLRSELVGPEETPDIILLENPVTRYAVGMLFPENFREVLRNNDTEAPSDSPETVEVGGREDDISDEVTAALANSFYPSAMGLSLYCKGKDPVLKVTVDSATYSRAEWSNAYIQSPELSKDVLEDPAFSENFEYENGKIKARRIIENARAIREALENRVGQDAWQQGLNKLIRSQTDGAWTRTLVHEELTISPNTRRTHIIDNRLDLVVVRKYIAEKDLTLFTIALQNVNDTSMSDAVHDEESVFFQTSFTVASLESKDVFEEYSIGDAFTTNAEDANLAMLYRNKKSFAVGHGCAASWTLDKGIVRTIQTESIPTYEMLPVSFDVEGIRDANTLQMRYLAEITGSKSEIINSLKDFCDLYEKWINGLKERVVSLPTRFSVHGNRNIELCTESLERMRDGVNILETNEIAYTAFTLANKAMLMQSLYSSLQKNRRDADDGNINWPKLDDEGSTRSKTWRPFQLAFLLLSIRGTVDPAADDRKIVDLIWFPTGGGKTEAYLGLTAFTIIHKKLQFPEKEIGTAVMMRYTLRLLTAQQFQRACTLICALEHLRRSMPEKLGTDPISIGLWVGIASTPNTVDQAKHEYRNFRLDSNSRCPSPVLACPWCGTRMIFKNGNGRDYAMRDKSGPKRIELYCKEQTCDFNSKTNGLPIKFIDEDIYRDPPTLLFGTVDKFAQMPKREGVTSIFGIDNGTGPELIIQDELHLISGALGTMVAIYETAVDFLSSRSGQVPKIVASTATVRRATAQCRSLFGREQVRQFPTPGLEIEDAFFSREDSSRPGRMYVGVMSSGKTQTTTSVRVAAKLFQSVYDLPSEPATKDKFWTLVSYFNSIRELGGFISLINDDIQLYASNLRQRMWRRMRAIYGYPELTSRRDAEEILQILEQLSIEYTGEDPSKQARSLRPIDILLATNMISVGVDIDRLGLMLIRGQPKMTSEYIQVSSRVGRRYPGLVVTLYNPARTRDRAHYERFVPYHASFYKFVEPSSITPFSLPARIRALASVMVTMARHTLPVQGFRKDRGAGQFRDDMPGLDEITKFLLARVKLIDPSEAPAVEQDIERIWREWQDFATNSSPAGTPVYSLAPNGQGFPLLANKQTDNRPMGWIAPNSMRNVDAQTNINTIDE